MLLIHMPKILSFLHIINIKNCSFFFTFSILVLSLRKPVCLLHLWHTWTWMNDLQLLIRTLESMDLNEDSCPIVWWLDCQSTGEDIEIPRAVVHPDLFSNPGSTIYWLFTVWPYTNHLASLNFNLLIFEAELLIPVFQRIIVLNETYVYVRCLVQN